MIQLTVRPGCVITQRHMELRQPAQRPASCARRIGSSENRLCSVNRSAQIICFCAQLSVAPASSKSSSGGGYGY
jgi:hypothetical protein